MLINRDAKPWVWVCAAVFVVCLATYIPYHRSALNGPSGGSWPGLIYGVVGTGMILLAMGLTPRKKLRTLRIGRAYWWLQAHVWFGLLSLPVILFHAGFRDGLWGGPMTVGLMVVFAVVWLSGIVGLVLQNVMPGKLLRDVQFETIFEQIDHVVGKLREEAEAKVASVTTRKLEGEFDLDAIPAGAAAIPAGAAAIRAGAGSGGLPAAGGLGAGGGPAGEVTAAGGGRGEGAMGAGGGYATAGAAELEAFYREEVVPALRDGREVTKATAAAFDRLRARTPLTIHEVIADLQSIVEERRQLERQRKLHYILHGWLWVHVPLSVAMLVMVVVHAVVALRYARPW